MVPVYQLIDQFKIHQGRQGGKQDEKQYIIHAAVSPLQTKNKNTTHSFQFIYRPPFPAPCTVLHRMEIPTRRKVKV
jgi:hypothetical protein